jgi:hypothetical protein
VAGYGTCSIPTTKETLLIVENQAMERDYDTIAPNPDMLNQFHALQTQRRVIE